MDEKLFMEVVEKYFNTMAWLNAETLRDIFATASLLQEAQAHTIKTTGCSVEKFRKLLIESPILDFELKDRHIIECYFDYLENIRSSRL
ncbi:hypothetical protein ACSSV9_14390 [Melioribacter sp. OK-6-Me]|uniref:hypothetical protein n=1 Tax=Melioribacter sp. OK-6-Me TaxID=3423433 RepID=UPI003EDA009E